MQPQQPPLTPQSEALRARQHRTAVQRAARKAFFDMSQARSAWPAAASSGRDAATALVNAHLTACYAPAWALPPPVAAQPGLAAAVARKLSRRAADAVVALDAALAALRGALAALDAAARTLAPTPQPPPAAACDGDGDAGAPAAAARPAVVPFNVEAYADVPIYTALPLSALGALLAWHCSRTCSWRAPHVLTRDVCCVRADALAAEVVAMHAAELALKERVAAALRRVAAADTVAAAAAGTAATAAAPGARQERAGGAAPASDAEAPPSREALTVWLSTWLLSPLLHTARLAEIDALVAAEMKSIEA
jgi:hypothetical protein